MIAKHSPSIRFRRLVSALTTGAPMEDSEVHFHRGPQGIPSACHDPHCASPRLDP